jgi:isopentenyl diphosphate isomerase/L-lactate dehydrogenase-like FMN-dependent dehydrogenase
MAFQSVRLVPSVMRDASARDHAVTVCGQELAAPLEYGF